MVNSILNFAKLSRLQSACNDDLTDRLNHIYTCFILVLFSIVVSSGHFAGNPIHCWCPADFTTAFVAYTRWICWVSNTYYVPMNKIIPRKNVEKPELEISYYQWVPFILLFQALMFKLPNLLWCIFHVRSGINLQKVCELVEKIRLASPEDRDDTIKNIAYMLDHWLEANKVCCHSLILQVCRILSRFHRFFCGRCEGAYLTILYLFIKLLYCTNVIGQLFLLNLFLAIDYDIYGVEIIKSLFSNETLKESPRFPRITLCDFEIRQMNNVNYYTVQCVLPINLYNERIFIFIWFWFVFVSILTCFSFLVWFYYIVFPCNKASYAKKYLQLGSQSSVFGCHENLYRVFANQYLRDDGIFVLRLIGKNTSDLILIDLINQLWKIFKTKPVERNKSLLKNKKTIELLS